MESEKVKEIKESLRQSVIIEEKIFGAPMVNSFNDILTYINELESENERLRKETAREILFKYNDKFTDKEIYEIIEQFGAEVE